VGGGGGGAGAARGGRRHARAHVARRGACDDVMAATRRRTLSLASALAGNSRRRPLLLATTAAPMAAAAAAAAEPLEAAQWQQVKAVLVGSGSDGMGGDGVSEAVLGLVSGGVSGGAAAAAVGMGAGVRVLYIGTPTYDLPIPAEKQCRPFAAAGCVVSELRLVGGGDGAVPPSSEDVTAAIAAADVILVSGGNPLYAVAVWEAHGLPALLREAIKSGTVICGGSCGLICWFDAGHSDSADPASYKGAMLGGATTTQESGDAVPAPVEGGATDWEYIRCPCLGILPGLVCPHHDRVQSNGVLRATDFDRMMRRHPGERGIAVDHWAALVLDGQGGYRVHSISGKPGSVGAGGVFVADGSGDPGIWLKEVVDSEVITTLLPSVGSISALLRPAKAVVEDLRVQALRLANPAV
jgi:dipeptidase E